MTITKLWIGAFDGLNYRIARYDNGDLIVSDDKATTVINQKTTLHTWYNETPNGPHWTALLETKLDPETPSRPMLLQAWDIGHRYDTDPRRAESINLLYQNTN